MDVPSIVPAVGWVRSYQRNALPRDVFAGLVLTAFHVVEGGNTIKVIQINVRMSGKRYGKREVEVTLEAGV